MKRCFDIAAVCLWLGVVARAAAQDEAGSSALAEQTALAVAAQNQEDAETNPVVDESSEEYPDPFSDAASEDEEGLEIDFWAWFGALHQPTQEDYWDIELSLAVTKTFDQRLTISAQGNLIIADGYVRAELGQGFASALLFEDAQTILTVGKFNANFGVEARDFWNRRTGTTSLLFGAQPQDIVGIMLTQPIGDTGIKIRPFLSADFQGDFYFDQSPAGGIKIEYQPCPELHMALTNWIGPGFVLYGGEPLHDPYPADTYGSSPGAVVQNWQGPNFVAERDSTLYYVQAKAVWQAFPDLTLSAEFLLGTTDSHTGQWGWYGWMFLADYSITDRLHVYGRFSYLNDKDWLVTGFFQTAREISVGFGYEFNDHIEVRGEYRRDFSNAHPDFDSLSIHLALTY